MHRCVARGPCTDGYTSLAPGPALAVALLCVAVRVSRPSLNIIFALYLYGVLRMTWFYPFVSLTRISLIELLTKVLVCPERLFLRFELRPMLYRLIYDGPLPFALSYLPGVVYR